MIKCDRYNQNYYFAITEHCVGNTLNTLEVVRVSNLFEDYTQVKARMQTVSVQL